MLIQKVGRIFEGGGGGGGGGGKSPVFLPLYASLKVVYSSTLFFSMQVNNSWVMGDVNGTQRSSQIAARLNIAALVTGITIPVVFVVLAVIGAVVSGATGSENNSYDY